MIIAATLLLVFVCLAAMLLWRLAIYALPLWCGGALAVLVHRNGNGLFLSLLAGLVGAIAALAIAYLLLGIAKSLLLRAGVGLAFAVPAAVAGYHAGHGIAAHFMADGMGLTVMAMIAGTATGVAAWGGALNSSKVPAACPDAAR